MEQSLQTSAVTGMYWLDTAILVILGVGAVWGAWKGLVWQVARIVSLAVSFAGTIVLNEPASEMIQDNLLQGCDSRICSALAYVGVFLGLYLILYVASRILYGLVRATDFLLLDRMLGAVFGAAKVGLVVAALCLALTYFQHPSAQDVMAKSKLAPVFAEGMETLLLVIPEDYKTSVRDSLQEMVKPPQGIPVQFTSRKI